MFQDDALFPHRDVAANIAFGLRMQGRAARSREHGWRSCSRSSASRGASTGPSRRSRVASASVSRSPARSRLRHACSCSTSRSVRSTARSTTGSSPSCVTCSTRSTRPPSTSPTTWPRRSRSAAASPCMRAGRILQVAEPGAALGRPADAWVARFIGLENVEERGATSLVTRPGGRRPPARMPAGTRSSSPRTATGRS